MNTWRYIATKELVDGEEHWAIREYYPDIDGEAMWTKRSEEPFGDTLDDLKRCLRNMLSDSCLPWLDMTVDPPKLMTTHPEDGV